VTLDVTIDLGQQVFREDHVDADTGAVHRRRRDQGGDAIAVRIIW
jgi:hypothetical protein